MWALRSVQDHEQVVDPTPATDSRPGDEPSSHSPAVMNFHDSLLLVPLKQQLSRGHTAGLHRRDGLAGASGLLTTKAPEFACPSGGCCPSSAGLQAGGSCRVHKPDGCGHGTVRLGSMFCMLRHAWRTSRGSLAQEGDDAAVIVVHLSRLQAFKSDEAGKIRWKDFARQRLGDCLLQDVLLNVGHGSSFGLCSACAGRCM